MLFCRLLTFFKYSLSGTRSIRVSNGLDPDYVGPQIWVQTAWKDNDIRRLKSPLARKELKIKYLCQPDLISQPFTFYVKSCNLPVLPLCIRNIPLGTCINGSSAILLLLLLNTDGVFSFSKSKYTGISIISKYT